MALTKVSPDMLDAAKSTAALATIADLKSIDSDVYKSAEVYAKLIGGHFDRDDTDLSFRLVTATVSSTSVASSVFTKAGHQLASGQVVTPTTSANGLTAGAKYWVIVLNLDTFRVASSYANYRSGTGITLSGSANQTFKRLLDPKEGMFVISAGDRITGEDGAWVRRWNHADVEPQWFGAKIDGTDDREAIMSALEVAAEYDGYDPIGGGYCCKLPGGTIGFIGEIYNYRNASLMGIGRAKTVLKNLSPTENAVTFERAGAFGPMPGAPPWTTGGINTSFGKIGGFTLEQNESAGRGIYVGGQYSVADDLMVRNQGGTQYALTLLSCTLTGFRNIDIVHSNYGIRIDNCYYPTLDRVSVEATEGYAVYATNSFAIKFNELYVDPWDQNIRDGLVFFDTCGGVDIAHLTSEMAGTSGVNLQSWFQFHNCEGVKISGGRIFHSSTQTDKSLFGIQDCSQVDIGNIWYREDADNMKFLQFISPKSRNIHIHSIYSRVNGANCQGITSQTVTCDNILVENWMDVINIVQHIFAVNNLLFQNTLSAHITIASGSVITLTNCRGVNDGPAIGLALKQNSA